MKRVIRIIFISFLFITALFVFKSNNVFAKKSANSVFEIEVGNENLFFNYSLVSSSAILSGNDEVGYLESNIISMKNGDSYTISEGKVLDEDDIEIGVIDSNTIVFNNSEVYTISTSSVKEKVVIPVTLKGLEKEGKSYRWEHNFCYKIVGMSEICELDKTGKDQEESAQDIVSNKTYQFSFWDGHMPYYSEDLLFEYVIFSNKFVSLEEGSNEEITLDIIEFTSSEIKYAYNYDVSFDYYEDGTSSYVGANNVSAVFVNNGSSSLILSTSPEYKFINEVCVLEDNCDKFETSVVYSNNVEYAVTPYIGNINFSYNNSYFAKENTNYENITFRTKLECLKNCESRRVVSDVIVIYEKTFSFDYQKPVVDVENTIIPSDDEYVKNVEIKISVSDDGSGLNVDGLGYQLIRPYYDSCSWGSSANYTYENGVSFILGSNLTDGPYCMRYYAYDNAGNYYVSENYYVFYFDNTGPTLNIDKGEYNDTDYYNEVKLDVSFIDYYAGIDKLYYLWSNNSVSEQDYLKVKNEGKQYDNSGKLSSLNDINSDGEYTLYFLAYDKLENYKFYMGGSFNFDVTSLSNDEVSVTANNVDKYSSDVSIKVNIKDVEDNVSFKCGLLNKDNVVIDDLKMICKNNEDIVLPSSLEGNYSLWIYASDTANNYSLLEVVDNLLLDTKGPSVSYTVLKDDNQYHVSNEITLTINDVNGYSSLKYGWFLATKNNVKSEDLTNTFENNAVIGYPSSVYGEYKLYVSAIDELGNESFVCFDKIFKVDTDVIRISLLGKESIKIIKGQNYKDAGAVAYKGDVSSGGRVSEVKVEGNVDINKPGVYYVTYSSGEGDLLVSVTRKVIVKDSFPYILSGLTVFVFGGIIVVYRLFRKRKENI